MGTKRASLGGRSRHGRRTQPARSHLCHQWPLDKAIPHYNRALELFPNYLDAYLFLGFVYFEMGNWELAEHNMEQVLRLNPEIGDDSLCFCNKAKKKSAAMGALLLWDED